jgi:hypothetical protein
MSHTQDELRFASKYFAYHLKMYTETFQWLNDNQKKPPDWVTIRNAILEAHLVHARSLISFFFPNNKRKDDIIATDYFSDFNPAILLFDKGEFLKNQVQIIGGQLVHLTTKQIPILNSEKDWPISEIKEQLVPIIVRFLLNVPINLFADKVIANSQSEVSRISPESPEFTATPTT